jgi:hypothetical protein
MVCDTEVDDVREAEMHAVKDPESEFVADTEELSEVDGLTEKDSDTE